MNATHFDSEKKFPDENFSLSCKGNIVGTWNSKISWYETVRDCEAKTSIKLNWKIYFSLFLLIIKQLVSVDWHEWTLDETCAVIIVGIIKL